MSDSTGNLAEQQALLDRIAEAIERRENVEFLIQRIEHHASEAD